MCVCTPLWIFNGNSHTDAIRRSSPWSASYAKLFKLQLATSCIRVIIRLSAPTTLADNRNGPHWQRSLLLPLVKLQRCCWCCYCWWWQSVHEHSHSFNTRRCFFSAVRLQLQPVTSFGYTVSVTLGCRFTNDNCGIVRQLSDCRLPAG